MPDLVNFRACYLGCEQQAASGDMPAMLIFKFVRDVYFDAAAMTFPIEDLIQKNPSKDNFKHYVMATDNEQIDVLRSLQRGTIYEFKAYINSKNSAKGGIKYKLLSFA